MCDQKINFSLKVDLGATAESSRCRSSTRRGSTVSLGFGVASRQWRSARRRRRKGRWNLAPPREKTPPPPPPTPLTTAMSEIEVEEGEDDSGRSTAAQGRDNIEWWRLLMTRPEAPPAVTEEEAARRAERRSSFRSNRAKDERTSLGIQISYGKLHLHGRRRLWHRRSPLPRHFWR